MIQPKWHRNRGVVAIDRSMSPRLLIGLLVLVLTCNVINIVECNNVPITDVHIVFSNHLDVGFDGIDPLDGFARNVVNKYFTVSHFTCHVIPFSQFMIIVIPNGCTALHIDANNRNISLLLLKQLMRCEHEEMINLCG